MRKQSNTVRDSRDSNSLVAVWILQLADISYTLDHPSLGYLAEELSIMVSLLTI